jgi:hypothetical protein
MLFITALPGTKDFPLRNVSPFNSESLIPVTYAC